MPRKRKADESPISTPPPKKSRQTNKTTPGKRAKTTAKTARNTETAGELKINNKKTTQVKDKKSKSQSTAKENKTKAPKVKAQNKAAPSTTPKASVPATTADQFSLVSLLKDERWKQVLLPEFEKSYFKNLEETLQKEYKTGKEIFPPKELIFHALHLTPLDEVKVVILGQDPYHDDGQAMGMSFSVPRGVDIPPSLRNIYNELERDPKIKGFKKPDHGCLEEWAKEGLLMINATLTVEAHKANSHSKFGWQFFTDSIIKAVSDNCDHVVFILWGGFAHKKEQLIDTTKHVTIKTAHPSPLSLNKFKNCNCFSDCDAALVKFGLEPIDWSLD